MLAARVVTSIFGNYLSVWRKGLPVVVTKQDIGLIAVERYALGFPRVFVGRPDPHFVGDDSVRHPSTGNS